MLRQEFINKIEESFKKHFPNGYICCSKPCLGNNGLFVNCGLISNKNNVINKIRQNDQLSIQLLIENIPFNDNDNILEDQQYTIEFHTSSLDGKPNNPYLAMSRIKIPCRKFNAVPSKIFSKLDQYFEKAKNIVIAERDKDNIYNQKNIDNIYLDLK